MDWDSINKSVNAEELLQFRSENIEERLTEWFEENSDQLPLLDMCVNGGSPSIDRAEVRDLKITEKNPKSLEG